MKKALLLILIVTLLLPAGALAQDQPHAGAKSSPPSCSPAPTTLAPSSLSPVSKN